MMGVGSIEIAQKKAAQGGAPVYLYNFGYKSEAKVPGTDYPMGTPHAADIAFKFNNVGRRRIRSRATGRSGSVAVAQHGRAVDDVRAHRPSGRGRSAGVARLRSHAARDDAHRHRRAK